MDVKLNIQPIGETIGVMPQSNVHLHESFSPFISLVAQLLRMTEYGTVTKSVVVTREDSGGNQYTITYTEAS